MKGRSTTPPVALAVVMALVLGACQLASSAPSASLPPGPSGASTEARVVAIVDGDTIRVEIAGQEFRLRYIGIDAPERGTPYADEATSANRGLVAGARVLLERDVSNTDRFDRLLRYVWVERDREWLFVNGELVRLGLAIAKRYPPDTGRHSQLEAAEREARRSRVGIWADGSGVLPSIVRILAGVAERQTQPA